MLVDWLGFAKAESMVECLADLTVAMMAADSDELTAVQWGAKMEFWLVER